MAFRASLLAGQRPLCNAVASLAPSVRRNLAAVRCPRAAFAAAAAAEIQAVPKVEVPTLAVAGSEDRFPVRRVYCVGSNYRFVVVL